jgi:hypothetical protein
MTLNVPSTHPLPPVSLFLDVDGVLSNKTYTVRAEIPNTLEEFHRAADFLDPNAVKNLHKIIRGLGKTREVWVIISSSWRWGFSVENLKTIFGKYEFSQYIQGKTIDSLEFSQEDRKSHCHPDLHRRGKHLCRAAEINRYLREHPEIIEFVILDDLNDHLDIFTERYVYINPTDLITAAAVNYILGHLFRDTIQTEIREKIVEKQRKRSEEIIIYREGAPQIKGFYPYCQEIKEIVAKDLVNLWEYFLKEEIKKLDEVPVLTDDQLSLFRKYYTMIIVDYLTHYNVSILELSTRKFIDAVRTIYLPHEKFELPCDLNISVQREPDGVQIKLTPKYVRVVDHRNAFKI